MALLQDKVAIITGGVTGIGRSIALGMAREGAKICVNHLPTDKQAELAEEMAQEVGPENFLAVPGDISKQETSTNLVAEAVKKFGEVNILVSNAGICEFNDFLETKPETYLQTIEINLNGCFFVTQAVGRQMKKQGKGGSIIGISSHQAHYTPTKAGILSLMQSCACALGQYGIRCNALLPGTIRTAVNEEDLADDEKRTYMENRTTLGRLGKPDDLAGPAIFLASDLSAYMTGSQLLVDGGLFVNLQ
ncbi:glucose 1-dehydrogenase II (GLCDH-II) [Yamadazyma tenuis ATCC 10573]|uniref:Glucose 1-dehydrogenase II (GLCDH-II) n=1 Tax=Candida tenuis (strain ATCC 10573 / BCRC 21748 / CBS 615 / JCM 9827 / NBRC 10315 / NRRL Y-1498 / VKM Y-70) TaxID=590646 RepID=G3B405_CANTC|nr:glucose 1-dehydrogenase II (GLCDH-II) [Yamadazyma tenuis ATCC 10573]EGV64291.1 glucose 1-dehydrogenase II (GLCDH-II) [Yamadazyma tenuis ATCC 10573]